MDTSPRPKQANLNPNLNAHAPSDPHWFGLVRHPIPDVEMVPLIWSHLLGGFFPVHEVARRFALARINVTETTENWRRYQTDYLSEKLDEIRDAYDQFEDEINVLPAASLGSLLAHLMHIARDAGRECIDKGWATSGDITHAWSTTTAPHAEEPLCTWLSSQITTSWTTPEQELPDVTYNAETSTVVIGGQPIDRVGLLLLGVTTIATGIESTAMAGLRTGKRHALQCLL